MGWILRLQNIPTMLYTAVAVLKRRIHIYKKLLYVLFWMNYAMFIEVESLK